MDWDGKNENGCMSIVLQCIKPKHTVANPLNHHNYHKIACIIQEFQHITHRAAFN